MPALSPANPVTADDVTATLEILAARVPDRHVTPDATMVATWLDSLRRYDRSHIFAAARTWDQHRFPAVAEFVGAVQQAARSAMEAEAARGDTSRRCPACDGNRLVEIAAFDESGQPLVHGHGEYRPCHMCSRDASDRWRGGHMAPDHDCDECKAIRRGRTPAHVT